EGRGSTLSPRALWSVSHRAAPGQTGNSGAPAVRPGEREGGTSAARVRSRDAGDRSAVVGIFRPRVVRRRAAPAVPRPGAPPPGMLERLRPGERGAPHVEVRVGP